MISLRFLRRDAALIGVLPIVSTARDVMQQAKAAMGIISWPQVSPVAKGLVVNHRHQLHLVD